MSTSLKKKRKPFDKPRNAGSDEWHRSPLMMQNAARLYCVQAEYCPQDRHLLRQRLRRTVLRAAPQNAGRQSGRLQELNAANLDVHPCSGTSGDGARFGCRAKSSPDDLRDSSFSINVGSIACVSQTSSRNIVLRKTIRWRCIRGHVGKTAKTDKRKETPAVHSCPQQVEKGHEGHDHDRSTVIISCHEHPSRPRPETHYVTDDSLRNRSIVTAAYIWVCHSLTNMVTPSFFRTFSNDIPI